METVVVLQIISNFFWLILVVLVIGVFRKQLRSLLDSLGTFEFAGVHLLFPRDKKGSLEQSAILSEVVLQLLEHRDASEQMIPLLSDKSARRLGTFAVRYAQDVPEDNQELEVILNVAMILSRKDRYSDAMQIIEAHLKNHPDDFDANQQKALLLFNTGVPAKVREADKIFDRLVDMYPTRPPVWFNRALTRSLVGNYDQALSNLNYDQNYDQALSDLKRAIELAFVTSIP